MDKMIERRHRFQSLKCRAAQSEGNSKMIVEGIAAVVDAPTVLYTDFDGNVHEVICTGAFDDCDFSNVIFNYNHGGKICARTRNKTLEVYVAQDGNLAMRADLSGTAAGRELYDEISKGYIDEMSFSFVSADEEYDPSTRTWRVNKIEKLYDVSAVDIPAYDETEIHSRRLSVKEYKRRLEQANKKERAKLKSMLI